MNQGNGQPQRAISLSIFIDLRQKEFIIFVPNSVLAAKSSRSQT
jgi:hypothetical protein